MVRWGVRWGEGDTYRHVGGDPHDTVGHVEEARLESSAARLVHDRRRSLRVVERSNRLPSCSSCTGSSHAALSDGAM